jgi:hypothetical protein
MRIPLIALALSLQLLLGFFVNQTWAAPCVKPPLSADAINQFKSNPEAIVAPNSDTRAMEALVRDLAGTDPTLAATLVQLARGTNPRFRTAIAAGLAQAAVACSTVDQNGALLIEQAVAVFDDGSFQSAFAAVAGDLATAAAAIAAVTADSSVGSVVITNPVGSGAKLSNPIGSGSPAFFQLTSSSALVTSSSVPGQSKTTTAATPVSATR